MKLGLMLPFRDLIHPRLVDSMVQTADRLGYESVWVPEAWGWDAFGLLAHLATVTSRIKLATGIVNVFSRSPALIAQSVATLDMLSGGRAVLGLGTSGHQVVSGWHGVPFERGLTRLRETVEIVRLILRREALEFEGEVFHLAGGLKLAAHPVRDAVPIYLAGITSPGVELAGEIADGWLPVFFAPQHFGSTWAGALAAGAARAGRPVERCAVCVVQRVVVCTDLQQGRELARPELALYIGGMGSRRRNYYKSLWDAYGFEAEAARIQDLYLEGHRREAAAAVTDAMVDLVTIIGPAEQCRERLQDLERVGVREAAVMLVPERGREEDLVRVLEELAA